MSLASHRNAQNYRFSPQSVGGHSYAAPDGRTMHPRQAAGYAPSRLLLPSRAMPPSPRTGVERRDTAVTFRCFDFPFPYVPSSTQPTGSR